MAFTPIRNGTNPQFPFDPTRDNGGLDFGRQGRPGFDLRPWALGSSLDMLLQGVILVQCYTYFTRRWRDRWYLRSFIGILLALSLFKSVTGLVLVFTSGAISRQFQPPLRNDGLENWMMISMPITTATIGLLTQIWYLLRIHRDYRSLVVFIVVTFLLGFSLASVTVWTVFAASGPTNKLQPLMWLHLIIVLLTNGSITGLVAWSAIRHKRENLDNLSRFERYLRMTFRMVIPATVFSLVSLIMSTIASSPFDFQFIIFNFILAKIYIISVLFLLNWQLPGGSRRVSIDPILVSRPMTSKKRPLPKTTLSKAFVNGGLPLGETNDNSNGDTTSTNMSKMANRSMEEEIWLAVQQRMDQRISFR